MSRKSNKNQLKFKKTLTKEILHVFERHPQSVFNYKQLASKLSIKDSGQRMLVIEILDELTYKEVLKEEQRGKFVLNSELPTIQGTLDFSLRGAAYLISEDLDDDIYIHKKNTGKAFPGDKVEVRLFKRQGKLEGEVVNVIERSKHEFIGILEVHKQGNFFRPDNRRIPVDFFIEKRHMKNAKNGDKVKIRFLTWPGKAKSPLGAVIDVLGKPGDINVEMFSILAENNFPYRFPTDVEIEAEEIKEDNFDELAMERRDMRDVLTFTIDPVDAKDFDDALSYQILPNNNIEIGVHIADVSHYVKPGSQLDLEAYERGNSVYLVDRVIPMLPEVLSNKLCSLRPNETKATFSAVFEFDKHFNLLNEWFGRTIIHSDRRFTYEEAQEIIEGKKDKTFEEPILLMDRIAKHYRKARLGEGALDIESEEVRFRIDETGKPIGIMLKVSKDSNKLIEEFMLLANKRVAYFVGAPEQHTQLRPMVYRVHDQPNEEKISDLKIFLEAFGYKIKPEKNKPISFALNKVMIEAKEKDELHIIGPMVIRSMSKAYYDTDNIGHYGLGFDYYTHFTSPIRRYADLLVHRILEAKIQGMKPLLEKDLTGKCKHISKTEKQATDAERASIKYMQVVYIQEHIGETFEGKITGVTDWGLFVEMDENKCEGLVHVSTLQGGSYYVNEKTKQMESFQSNDKYHLGQKVKVIVKHADVLKKQIDLELITG